MNLKGAKKKNQVIKVNNFEEQKLLKKEEVVRKNLTASIWHEMESLIRTQSSLLSVLYICFRIRTDRALLVLPCHMDDCEWNQCYTGKSICCKTDQRGGR